MAESEPEPERRVFYLADGTPIDIDELTAEFRAEQDARHAELQRELAGLSPIQAVQRLQGLRAAAEAAQIAEGWRHLTVEHGPLEDADHEQHVHALFVEFEQLRAAHPGSRWQGGDDYVTFAIAPPDAETAVARMAATAQRLDPGWWQLRYAT